MASTPMYKCNYEPGFPDWDTDVHQFNSPWDINSPHNAQTKVPLVITNSIAHSTTLPPGWPTHLDSEMAWDRSSFDSDENYTHILTIEEKEDIETALHHFKALGLDGKEITRETFPLPTLQKALHESALAVHRGRGFVVLRGLAIDRYTEEDSTLVFLGISSYIGERRGKQDDEGSIFGHVREATQMAAAQEDRLATDSRIGSLFHNDIFCDVLGMQVKSCAARGGDHLVASSWNIFNKLVATRPDLLQILAKPDWAFNTRHRLYQENDRPLFYFHDGRIILNFHRQALTDPDFKRKELTALQLEALDAIQELATNDQVVLKLQPGDLMYINNFGLVHGREAFENDRNHSRYLMRIWLKSRELAWKLPEPLELGNRKVFDDDPDLDEKWNVRYTPKLEFDIRDRLAP